MEEERKDACDMAEKAIEEATKTVNDITDVDDQ